MSRTRNHQPREAKKTNIAAEAQAKPRPARSQPAVHQSGRLVSLDALRGFNMFWIIGGAELFAAIAKYVNHPWLNAISRNLTEHVEWEGFHFHDMIFPLFLFIMGVTFPFSLAKRGDGRTTRGQLVRRVLVRAALLIFLGWVYYGLFDLKGIENQRIMGVLQRLGLAWGIAALIALYTGIRGQVASVVALLVGYWLAMRFAPVPNFHPGDLSPQGNFANYLDRVLFLPGQNYKSYGDPEGLFSTIPATATAMLGILTGHWLRSKDSPERKLQGLAVAGVACLALGHLWGLEFPVIKKIWTSSYVLVAAGWSLLLLGAFYGVIEVCNRRSWTFFFVVIGMNPITIYVGERMIDFEHTAKFFLGGLAKHYPSVGTIIIGTGVIVVEWLFLLFLYRRKIFLKV